MNKKKQKNFIRKNLLSPRAWAGGAGGGLFLAGPPPSSSRAQRRIHASPSTPNTKKSPQTRKFPLIHRIKLVNIPSNDITTNPFAGRRTRQPVLHCPFGGRPENHVQIPGSPDRRHLRPHLRTPRSPPPPLAIRHSPRHAPKRPPSARQTVPGKPPLRALGIPPRPHRIARFSWHRRNQNARAPITPGRHPASRNPYNSIPAAPGIPRPPSPKNSVFQALQRSRPAMPLLFRYRNYRLTASPATSWQSGTPP